MDDITKPIDQNNVPQPVVPTVPVDKPNVAAVPTVPTTPVEVPKTSPVSTPPVESVQNVVSTPTQPMPTKPIVEPDDFYSSGYVPKPGEVIRPQHLIDEENLASRVDQYKSPAPTSVPSVGSPTSFSTGSTSESLTSISGAVVSENSKNPTGPVAFPNPFDDPNSLDAAALKAKADDLKKAGVGVVKSAKFKKIAFITLGSVFGILLLIIGFNILWPILFPPKEEIVAPPIITPVVVKEEPKEDKTSLKYLDGKVRELKPSLDELNNDSLFMLELKLEDSDFEKNAGL